MSRFNSEANVSNDPNNDEFFNDANEIPEPKSQNRFTATLQASRKFNFGVYEHFTQSVIITIFSTLFLLFSVGTFIYHVIGIVTAAKSRSLLYWVITMIGDCLGMVAGGLGIITIVFYKVPKVRFWFIVAFGATFFIYVAYMLITSVYGFLFYAEVTMSTPWIITVIAVTGVFEFLVIWFLFHVCWSVKEQMEQKRVPGIEYSNLPQDEDED